jgi:hypothetical protein
LSASLPVPGTPIGPKGSATEDTWGSFMRAFESAQQNVTNRGRLGSIWPLFELFKDKNEEHSKIVKEWLDPLVQHALTNKRRLAEMEVARPIADKSFMQHLADSTDGKTFFGKYHSFDDRSLIRFCTYTRSVVKHAASGTRYGWHFIYSVDSSFISI